MAKKSPQTALNSHFAMVEADLQTRLQLAEDGLSAVLKTLSDLLQHLESAGVLPDDAEFAENWQVAAAILRERGLSARPLPGQAPEAGVVCPQCNSRLRNVEGAPGDRCDWCGHVFVLICPSCHRELEHLSGSPGDICLGCQHQF